MDLSKGNSIFQTCFILLRLIWIGITEFLPRIWLCPLHVFALHRPILFCLFFSPFFSLNQFIYFNWRLITLHYCGSFCHTLTRISHWCTCVPHSEPPHLPPHPIPLGCPSAPALNVLFHASNLDWSSISQWQYTCFSAIFSNHPTLAFIHRVQKSVLYICVSFAVSHLESSLPSF